MRRIELADRRSNKRGGATRVLRLLGGTCFLFLGALPAARGSQQAGSPRQGTSPTAPLVGTVQPSYLIQVGDQLDIKLFYNSELNEQVTVRPDGRISVQLANEVVAAGVTAGQLRESLIHIFASQLKKPELSVIVGTFSSQKLFFDGEVRRPGALIFVWPARVFGALS